MGGVFRDAFSLPQVVGYVAFVFGVASFLQKRDNRMKALNAVQCVVYAIHFALLHNLPASASNGVGLARNLLSLRTRSPWAAGGLVIATVALGAYTIQSPTGLIPIVATVISIYGMFWLEGVPFRLCMLVCTGMWLVNNLISRSYGGLMLEATIATANIFTITRLVADGKKGSNPI